MTSYFALYHGLSQVALDAYRRYGSSPRSVHERLHFYLIYLEDVVPNGITVHHIPIPPPPHQAQRQDRENIQLLTPSGEVFMTALISLENNVTGIEYMAAEEAYNIWLRRRFAHRNFHFFTGLLRIRFCEGAGDDDWDRVEELHPVHHARQVAEYLQHQYERALFSR